MRSFIFTATVLAAASGLCAATLAPWAAAQGKVTLTYSDTVTEQDPRARADPQLRPGVGAPETLVDDHAGRQRLVGFEGDRVRRRFL